MTKLGKKQDAHIVASDAELDAKLEVTLCCRKHFKIVFVYLSPESALCALYAVIIFISNQSTSHF